MRLTVCVLALVLSLFSAFTPALAASPVSPPLAERLDHVVLRSQLGQFWGAVLVVHNGERVLAKGYGYANDTLAPIDAQTLFDIGSIAKPFTAALALKLHHNNRINLDEPITSYVPSLPSRANKVTLRHLLTHTSGLSDSRGAIQALDFADRDEAIRLAFQRPLSSEPGERFEYCNGGYCIAAAIIERVIGGPFQSLMREEIFKPAGLRNTGFLDGDGLDLSNTSTRIVSSRGGESRRTILQDGWGWGLRGCGGILTSLDDLQRFDAALRADTLFNDNLKRELYTAAQDNYALGWNIEATASGATQISHSGGTRGYRAQFLRIPERGIAIAVLTNDRYDPITLARNLLEELLPEERRGVTASLHIDGLELNEHMAAVIDRDIRIEVQPKSSVPDAAPEEYSLTLEVAKGDTRAPAVQMTLMPGEARRVAAEIRSVLRSKLAGERIPQGVELTVATMPYTPVNGTIDLGTTPTLTVMPRYSGVGDGGKRITDERVCIVLMDEANGFWPTILKLDRPAAEDLASQLESAPRP